MNELHFQPGEFRKLFCADCQHAVDIIYLRDYGLISERFVCNDCHPGRAQHLADLQRLAASVKTDT